MLGPPPVSCQSERRTRARIRPRPARPTWRQFQPTPHVPAESHPEIGDLASVGPRSTHGPSPCPTGHGGTAASDDRPDGGVGSGRPGRDGPTFANQDRGRTDHDDHEPPRRSSSRARPAWSAATPSRRPSAAGIASAPWSAPSSDTRWLDALGRREGRRRPGRPRGPPPGGRRGRLGLQLRGQGRRLGDARGVPPPQRRGPPPPARRRRRRPGRAVRPRQLARRLRGPRPLRHRRDRPPRRPTSLDAYTRSKIEAEALALRYVAERGLPLAIVRPGFIYGPRDRTVLPKLLDALRARPVRLLRVGRAGR